jgi:Ca2+-binding EF-hand superfamily protein
VKWVFSQCNGEVYDFPKVLALLSEAINCPSTEVDLKLSFNAFDRDGDGAYPPHTHAHSPRLYLNLSQYL